MLADERLLWSKKREDRLWPTAAVPYVRRKRVLEDSGSCRERQLTSLVANSRNRPQAVFASLTPKQTLISKHDPLGGLSRSPLNAKWPDYDGRKINRRSSKEIRQSMPRKGDCWDNAPMEGFFHTLKTEPVMHCDYGPGTGRGQVCSTTWRCSIAASGGTRRSTTRPLWSSRRHKPLHHRLDRSWARSLKRLEEAFRDPVFA